jgi:hypothetical protein
MHVFGYQGPCITGCSRLLQQTREFRDKNLPVRVIFKYRFAFDSSNDDMMQDAGGSMRALRGIFLNTIFSQSINIECPYLLYNEA